MRGFLRRIVERLEFRGSIFPQERRADQFIRKLRVLRKRRSVAVGSVNILIADTFRAVLSIVAAAADDSAERLHPFAEPGFSAVVFIPHDNAAPGLFLQLKAIIVDHTDICALCVEIDCSEIFAADAFMCLIVMTEHLIAAADGKKSLSILNRRLDVSSLAGPEILQQNLLFEILPSAYEKEIELRKVGPVADPKERHIAVDAAPLQTLLKAADIAAVSV
jgi:hypothetical protein